MAVSVKDNQPQPFFGLHERLGHFMQWG